MTYTTESKYKNIYIYITIAVPPQGQSVTCHGTPRILACAAPKLTLHLRLHDQVVRRFTDVKEPNSNGLQPTSDGLQPRMKWISRTKVHKLA